MRRHASILLFLLLCVAPGTSVAQRVVRFDVDAADPLLAGPIDCLAEMTLDGRTGHGLFEYTLFGRTDGFAGPGHFNARPGS